jgi:hypothetical protein
VRETGHLLQIERPQEAQTVMRKRLRSDGFELSVPD